MRLEYLGHACFSVTRSDGLVIVLDPYRPGALGGRIRHAAIDVIADIVVVTHYHEDHGWIGGLSGDPVVVDTAMSAQGIEFACVWMPHDTCGGAHMGMSRMMAFTVDGIRVLHPGDLGRRPTPVERQSLGSVDCLLLPVGGRFTLDPGDALSFMQDLAPSWTVPMHYRSADVDLDIESRDAFVAGLPESTPVVRNVGASLSSSTQPGVVLLEPRL